MVKKQPNGALTAFPDESPKEEGMVEKILRLTGHDITRCPKCKSQLIQKELPLPERPPQLQL